jgi:hypothetical protein
MIVTKDLREVIKRKRQSAVLIDGKLIPGSALFLKNLIATTNDANDRDDLFTELAGEYLRAGLDDEHLLIQRQRVSENPEAAVMWLALAHSLSLRADGAVEAKAAIKKGLEISLKIGTLIRYSLICQADVARKIGDSQLFEKSLTALVADAHQQRTEDSGFMDYILIDLPEGFCSPSLEAQYRNLVDKQL